MRMDGQDESSNVEDVRGMSGGGGGGFRHRRRRPRHRQHRDRGHRRLDLRHQSAHPARPDGRRQRRRRRCSSRARRRRRRPTTPARASSRRCCSSTEVVWTDVFKESGRTYQPPEARALQRQLADRLRPGRGGDGAVLLPERPEGLHRPELLRRAASASSARPASSRRPTSIAHEVGHHVQNQLGIMRQGRRDARPRRRGAGQRAQRSRRAAGRLLRRRLGRALADRSRAGASSRATSRRRSTPPRRSATTPCSARPRGTVVPETFTHGTSAQRVSWFKRGVESGSVDRCNTFEGARPLDAGTAAGGHSCHAAESRVRRLRRYSP